MPNLSEYLQKVSAGVVIPFSASWVQLSNNVTGITYVSLQATDATGLFTVQNVPAGLYTVLTGPSNTGPWVTTGDTRYPVGDENGLYNVIDYGAKGDGITDDSVAINAAIAAIPNPAGGTLWFPATQNNVYLCGAKVRINTPNVAVQFGGGTTLKSKNSLNDDLFWISATNVSVVGGIFDGNKANNTAGGGIVVDGSGVTISGVTINTSAVQNCFGDGVSVKASVATFNTTDVVIDRVSVTNTRTAIVAVVRTGGSVDMVTIRNCTVNTTVQHGINVTGANRAHIEGNKLLNVGLNKVSGFAHGIAIDGNSGTNPCQEHRVVNNRIIQPEGAGIEVADSITSCEIAGNTVSGAGNGASPSATYGIYFGGGLTLSTRAQIFGNTVTLSKGHGIQIGGPDASHLTTSVSVIGNTSILNGNNGIFLLNVNIGEVTGNTSQSNSKLASNSFSGIDLNNVTRVVVSNNVLTDTQGSPTQSRAINERGASDYNELLNNIAYGNVTSPYILVIGTHTVNRGNQGDTGNIELYNVKDYGAKGDGVTDDTAAITAAWTASGGNGIVHLPPGNYIWSGPGLNGTGYFFTGAGARGSDASSSAAPGTTTITIASGQYFIDTNQVLNNFQIRDIMFLGGKGMFHSTFTGAQPDWDHCVERCYFRSYTECAIGHNNPNMPFWKFSYCQFYGINTAIGVALCGQCDSASFDHCSFWNNLVGVKLSNNGVRASFNECDFIPFSVAVGVGRIFIWVLPGSSDVGVTAGMTAFNCTFSGEQLDPSDYCIVYADQLAGSDFVTQLPNFAADSTGVIKQHTFRDCSIIGRTGQAGRPFVYSTTPNLTSCRFVDLKIANTSPSYIIQFRTPPSSWTSQDRDRNRNLFGPFNWQDHVFDPSNAVPPLLSNAPVVGYVFDPQGIFQDNQGLAAHQWLGGSDYVGFQPIFKSFVRVNTLAGGMTGVAITDAEGRQDARELTAVSSSSQVTWTLTSANFIPGAPIWVEFDLKQGSSSSLTSISIGLTGDATNPWKRMLTLPATWQRYRFLVAGVNSVPGPSSFFAFVPGAGTFDIGRIRVYHAREPIPFSSQLYIQPTAKVVALTDTATVLVDPSIGTYYTLAATTSRTIDQPLVNGGVNNFSGMTRTFEILNSSGGAMTTTWHAAYNLAGAWTDPANGKRRVITFFYNGTNWIEQTRTGADI